MDLEDVSDFENRGDASERHDLVMQLASEGDCQTLVILHVLQRLSFAVSCVFVL